MRMHEAKGVFDSGSSFRRGKYEKKANGIRAEMLDKTFDECYSKFNILKL
mgnify:CR=1 FL=1